MSNKSIRAAFEVRLAAMAGALATAYQNVGFVPVEGTPYQTVHLLPAQPDNSEKSGNYLKLGIFQITLKYPKGTGPGAADAHAFLIEKWFRRGTTLQKDGYTVNIIGTPAQSPELPTDENRYVIAMSIRYQCFVPATALA